MVQLTNVIGASAGVPAQMNSRRHFLKASTGALLGLALPSVSLLTGCVSGIIAHNADWTQLQRRLKGVLLRPGNVDFQSRALPWALQYAANLPQGIAQCANESDVQACLQWAQANQIELVARSGGHSYAGYSTTPGLMVDVSAMNSVGIDPASGQAILGGGARNKHVYAACRPLQRAVTHGRCKDVGVAGLVLGGGIGFNMRAQGLTCDQLLATRIALADGRILNCSETENSDLFWACRGAGGGNFGIHTQFTFRTFPVGVYTVFAVKWNVGIAETFAAIQAMALGAPDTFGMKLSVVAVRQNGAIALQLSILGQLAGSEAQLRALLAPVFAVQAPLPPKISEMAYWDAQEFLSEDGRPEYSHERSRFVRNELSGTAIQTILTQLNQWPGTGLAATWKFFLMGGQIDARQPDDMAFIHRGYCMISSIELEWLATDDADLLRRNEAWLEQFHERMATYTSDHCYQNFIDPSQGNYLEAYYGEHLEQLRQVKRKYDPGNLFNYPQSIPL